MKVLIADKFEAEGVAGLEGLGCEVIQSPDLEGESLADAVARAKPDALIVRSTKVGAAVIAAGESLRLIIRAGAGTDNIDSNAATERGIAVCNCPGMNADAVAELTMGLMIACDRRIVEQTNQLAGGRWNKKEFSKSRGLKGRHLLVVGTGAIGLGVVRRAKAFGMHVSVQSRSLTRKWATELGVGLVGSSREDLLKALPDMDVVSMHVPLGDDTMDLCNADFFGAMKPGSIFLNTSRGGVVDESALLEAVEKRGIRAGVDVYNDQPSGKDEPWQCPLAGVPGVVTTHHCGASTDQAQIAVAEEVVRIIRVYQAHGTFENRVNG